MHRFEILSQGAVIGTSDLEYSDPPIGGASGRFYPNAAYWPIQKDVALTFDRPQQHLELTLRAFGNTELIETIGITILNASDELGVDSIEVHVVGISNALYEQLFPGRYSAYQADVAP